MYHALHRAAYIRSKVRSQHKMFASWKTRHTTLEAQQVWPFLCIVSLAWLPWSDSI